MANKLGSINLTMRKWILSQYPFRRGRHRFSRLLGISHLNIPSGTIIRTQSTGLKFQAGPDPVFFDLYYFGAYEVFETDFMRRALKPGDTMFDIGANFGWFSLHALELVGRTGSVWAFEPQATLCEELKANAALNGFANTIDQQFIICNCAVGEREGDVSFTSYSGRSHAYLSMYDSSRGENLSQFSVKINTLDTIVANMPTRFSPPAFVKCDVEGAEFSVLKGGVCLLESDHKPIILVEINHSASRQAGWQPQEMISFLENCGYTDFLFVSHVRRPTKINPGIIPLNPLMAENGNLVAYNRKIHERRLTDIDG
jgi:FkbM family methyltransferase